MKVKLIKFRAGEFQESQRQRIFSWIRLTRIGYELHFFCRFENKSKNDEKI